MMWFLVALAAIFVVVGALALAGSFSVERGTPLLRSESFTTFDPTVPVGESSPIDDPAVLRAAGAGYLLAAALLMALAGWFRARSR